MPNPDNKDTHAHGHSHTVMMIMCVVLMGGAFLFFSGADLESGLSLATLAPLLLCVGAHFLMHRFMGHDGQHKSHAQEPSVHKRTQVHKRKKQISPPRIPAPN
ncbi:hypothetical protein V5T82_09620 [Magnetovibrio sp. PR-2]|uniref:hypothetical protein n=1 Tax=Magnetovibrio sp. PR-2 TaxID=3120356 RepID=UPI002FCE099C